MCKINLIYMYHELEVTDRIQEGIYDIFIALGNGDTKHGSFFHIVSWTTFISWTIKCIIFFKNLFFKFYIVFSCHVAKNNFIKDYLILFVIILV